jgi:hypothetical protein
MVCITNLAGHGLEAHAVGIFLRTLTPPSHIYNIASSHSRQKLTVVTYIFVILSVSPAQHWKCTLKLPYLLPYMILICHTLLFDTM